MPKLCHSASGGWQVTWGHLCDSGMARSPSQPQPCPWAAAALSHVMAHASPGHILAPASAGHTLSPRLACDFCPLPGWAHPQSCLAPQTPPRLPQPKALAEGTGYFLGYFCATLTQKTIFCEAPRSIWQPEPEPGSRCLFPGCLGWLLLFKSRSAARVGIPRTRGCPARAVPLSADSPCAKQGHSPTELMDNLIAP